MSGTGVGIGQRPETRKQTMVKLLWTGIWLVYLSAPVSDLLHGDHGVVAVVLGWFGLAVFVAWYLALLFRTGRRNAQSFVLVSSRSSRPSRPCSSSPWAASGSSSSCTCRSRPARPCR